jgi:L-glyceraldehyde 3-phosphate reductase
MSTFYSHRMDPNTPLEETMGALDAAVRAGKATYVGVSSYSPDATRKAAAILKSLGTPCTIHQPSYSMLNRWIEQGLLATLGELGIGCIGFSVLAQGMLSDKYLAGVPSDSRGATGGSGASFKPEFLAPENLAHVKALAGIAKERGQSLAQMAIAWTLRDARVTSALVGARTVAQLDDSLDACKNLEFTPAELVEIDKHAVEVGCNLWAQSSNAEAK